MISNGVSITGASVFPHTSVTTVAVGNTCASAKQFTVDDPSIGTTGLVIGSIIINWVTNMKFPQSSVTRYLLSIVSGHEPPPAVSSSHVTIGVAPLSASSSTTNEFSPGTNAKHSTLISAGSLAVGMIASPIVNV